MERAEGMLFEGDGRDFDGTVEIVRQIFVAEDDEKTGR